MSETTKTPVNLLTVSNLLSLCRVPLAILFLPQVTLLRCVVLLLAGVTDYLDGFLARRFRATTPFGAVLDPLMDKFFIVFVASVLVVEELLSPWAGLLMISRDFLLLGIFLALMAVGAWKTFQYRAPFWGKVITVVQYAVVAALVLGFRIPLKAFITFPLLALCYLVELVVYYRHVKTPAGVAVRAEEEPPLPDHDDG